MSETFKPVNPEEEKDTVFVNKNETLATESLFENLIALGKEFPTLIDSSKMHYDDADSIIAYAHKLVTDNKKMNELEEAIKQGRAQEAAKYTEQRKQSLFSGRRVNPVAAKWDEIEDLFKSIPDILRDMTVSKE